MTADFWVRAYLRRLEGEGITAFIAAKGDATAGAVMIVVATLDGQARVFQRSFDLQSGARVWVELMAGTEAEVSASVAAQRRFDPDLWVVEVEDRAGRHLLDAPGLE
nr:DUF1491 family protein [Palleronia pontilimi]